MSNIRKYIPSDNNVICDVCGKKRKVSECVLSYGTGLIPVVMACRDKCADYLHPLNYPPPVIFDGRPVPDARPEQTDIFITVNLPTVTLGNLPSNLYAAWGSFNGTNDEFNLNPIITWGNFHS